MKLTKEDVWGKYDENWNKISPGMIIAKRGEKCPIWGDIVKPKSVTIKCTNEQQGEVTYWLDYVLGGNSVSKIEVQGDYTYLRADYKCW